MAEDERGEAPQRWVLRGWARVSFLLSVVLAVLLLGVGLVLAEFALSGATAGGALVPAGVLLAVGLLIGSQVVRCATTVVLHPDGTLECRRLVGSVRTGVDRVRGTSRSIMNYSGRRTPTVLHTADGAVLLTHRAEDLADMMTAIDRRRPRVIEEREA